MRKSRLSGALVVAGVLALCRLALAAEFTAEFTETRFGKTSTGKVYVKGENTRRETTRGKHKSITIHRADKKVTWILDPAQKTYIEMRGRQSGRPSGGRMAHGLKDLGTRKLVGKEKVNGYLCDKYAFVYKDKAMGTQYQWVSPKLKFMIKLERKTPKFSMLMEYTKIKEGKVPASMFELPKGYTKVTMPAGRPTRH
ncbi:MAG TPA: DUF4412 domain-containing protein [Armatimonadota bacterium]|nr:DUF4412 domain-containing protein [Armatimonadota bacterium]